MTATAPTTPTGTTLVIGATGTTGSRTTAQLVAAGRRVKAGSRRATPLPGAEPVRFDWYDPACFGDAVAGADRVYLVPPVGDPDPAAVMLPFLDRARAAGVRRAVLLSSSAITEGGPAVGQVHRALPGLFDEWAVLRPSWFMQNFTGTHAHADSIRADGVIRTAAGTGRVGFVDADDIAAVAARALTDDRAPGTDLVLTGPQTLSHDDIAALLTEVTGHRVVHHHLTYEAMRDRLAAVIPTQFAAMLAGMDRSIAEGAEDRTTDTVHRLTGRPPHDFRTVAVRELSARSAPATAARAGRARQDPEETA
ncbi:oxidoreductase [Streptomyces nojiriensis]|uniref:Oxidoreductase n=1 Tax=Streptomyces nojiriensis TaxID=66374 RepID=A0ABQ3SNG8_9ACTN|nr:NAD(P)H-binding protein [Streptomyces nojiriensis]QTI43239.1 NAD(P)H azoreductase [Streptomyces nojiriensis]GGS11572.1 oxidoreductase [Streptomyces nojiriensis]GHI69683.1 oxidoreductase [Streptomyces nojiriensis]